MGVLDNPMPTGLSASLNSKVAKGELAVRMADYAPVADGSADDSTKIQTAANTAATAGLFLDFDGTKRYNINAGVVFPAGTRLRTNGCTFVKTVNNNTYVFKTGDRFTADRINLEITGGASNDAGIWVNGNDTVIEKITVTSLTADQPGANALLVGDLSTQKTNIRINSIDLTGFRSPMRVINVAGSRLSNCTISNFMTGVYVINTVNTTFDKFVVTGTSAASTGGAGQNGMLLEAQNNDLGCINLRFRDWLVDGSPEHAYRIGGGLSVADITFTKCIARNPGNAPGNVATGGGSFKVLGTNGHMHQNIELDGCTGEDGNTSAVGINNHSQFSFGYVDGLTVINPRIRARNKTYSGQIGIILFACRNVDIVQPRIRDVLRQALYILRDATEPSPPIGVSGARVNGGFFDGGSTNNVIALDPAQAIISDTYLDNVTVSRGGSGIRWENPTTVGSDVGAYSNDHVKLRYVNAPTGSTTPPVNAPSNAVTVDYTGPIYGSSSIPSADGGLYLNTGDGKRYIRKVGAWTQQ